MNFEIGKFYQHATGKKMAILGSVETTLYGKVYVAEQSDRADLMPIGWNSEEYAENWKEISKEEGLECFDE